MRLKLSSSIGLAVFLLLLTACEKDDEKSKCNEKEDSLALQRSECGSSMKADPDGEGVTFTGYVQRAFEIKVNGITFADTEDFYTRFIPELVTSNEEYAAVLKDATVSVQGDYGIQTFGIGAPVVMSNATGDGHIFESRTDGQAKFTMKVKPQALDEVFKARVVVRIGLQIDFVDDAKEDLRYCYLLHSIRDSIAIDENTKPIIFDDFKTQLNTYRCEDVSEEGLKIPLPTVEEDIEGGASGGDLTVTKYNISASADSNFTMVSYRPDDGSLYIVDLGDKVISKFMISDSVPSPISSTPIPWEASLSGDLSAWDANGNFYNVEGNAVEGTLVRYDEAFEEQGRVAISGLIFDRGPSGGVFVDGGILYYKVGGSDNPDIAVIAPGGEGGKLFTANWFSASLDTEFLRQTGLARVGATTYLLAKKAGNAHLVAVTGSADVDQAHMIQAFLGPGEELRHMTSDGSHIWILSSTHLWRVSVN